MVRRGHDVTVIADRTPKPYTHEGVKVLSVSQQGTFQHVKEYAKDADILITHLDVTSQAMLLALTLEKPLVHFVHNDAQLSYWGVDPRVPFKASLVVFNSHWIADKEVLKVKDETIPWPGDSIVLHPVVEPHEYKCEKGTKVTLVNPTPGKGVEVLYELARQMPDYEFITVAGCYGEQLCPPNIPPRERVEHIEHTPDIREVFRKTKVLLMPSKYESYGRVAVEAACAGIPTIAHPTEGLVEALGAAGIFINRDDIPSWKTEIERLYFDEVYYRKRSDLAMKLANSLDPESEFDRLEDALLDTVDRHSEGREVTTMKMWTSDRRIWRTQDGGFKAEVNGRIPQDAVSMYIGIGGEIPEEVAIKNGWVEAPQPAVQAVPEEAKAVEAPQEDKAIEAPAATKRKSRKRIA